MNKPELLMPAGDLLKMRFAFAYGADAVYLGIPKFSLRARENGFRTFKEVAEAVIEAQAMGKKVYVTANIFPHNSKVASFVSSIEEFVSLCQPDAFIMSDPGLIMLMKEHFPKQIIHVSVQANTLNYAAAQFWQKMGASRIIVSREISIKEMADIHAACPEMELEAFVHGAICMAYSGRCLISNYLSHRDGNQGICTNSCRWEYKVYRQGGDQSACCQDDKATKAEINKEYKPLDGTFFVKESQRPDELFELDEDENGSYLMNSKDLCAIHALSALRDAGICSFKVEGRSKTIYYVAMIARAYRRAIDDMMAGRPFNKMHFKDIFATANRGFIEGFLYGNPGVVGQEYLDSHSQYTSYRYAGEVLGYDAQKGLLKVALKNPIRRGASYELCLPNQDIVFEAVDIRNDQGIAVEALHGGLTGWIAYPKDPGPFALLREPLASFDPQSVIIEKTT